MPPSSSVLCAKWFVLKMPIPRSPDVLLAVLLSKGMLDEFACILFLLPSTASILPLVL
jgi:hypothetical protein